MVYVCYVDKSIRGRSLNIYFEIILRTLDLSRYYLKEVINYQVWYISFSILGVTKSTSLFKYC